MTTNVLLNGFFIFTCIGVDCIGVATSIALAASPTPQKLLILFVVVVVVIFFCAQNNNKKQNTTKMEE